MSDIFFFYQHVGCGTRKRDLLIIEINFNTFKLCLHLRWKGCGAKSDGKAGERAGKSQTGRTDDWKSRSTANNLSKSEWDRVGLHAAGLMEALEQVCRWAGEDRWWGGWIGDDRRVSVWKENRTECTNCTALSFNETGIFHILFYNTLYML